MIPYRRRGVLVSGVLLLFRWFLPIFLDLSTCCLCSCWFSDWVSVCTSRLLIMKLFLFLSFPSNTLAPLLYDCWGPLQALLVWGTPVASAEQWRVLPVSSSPIFVPEWCPPNVSLISPFWGDSLDIRVQGAAWGDSLFFIGAQVLSYELHCSFRAARQVRLSLLQQNS